MKIPTTTVLLWCLSLVTALAQPAPDFTITTADNVQRKLYETYLDQGKSVVLHVFFTTCPICNAMAPLIEPFYQEWGGGNGPVEFISLSIQNNDRNFDVGRYHTINGFTFPGAGSDGGAREAILPFTNGTYGPFVGTPTFIIIAPDSTVYYNPRGDSFEATIDSIDQILRAIHTEKPASAFTVPGSVRTVMGAPISGVSVDIRRADHLPLTTDETGDFILEAEMVGRDVYGMVFRKDGDYTNGVSTYDIVRIQRHLLGIEPFTSPYQYLAADVDRSRSVNVADLIHLRKLILSVETSLPNGRSWIFINPDYQFIAADDPFFEAYVGEAAIFPVKAVRDMPPVSVLAIKIGDLDFNAR